MSSTSDHHDGRRSGSDGVNNVGKSNYDDDDDGGGKPPAVQTPPRKGKSHLFSPSSWLILSSFYSFSPLLIAFFPLVRVLSCRRRFFVFVVRRFCSKPAITYEEAVEETKAEMLIAGVRFNRTPSAVIRGMKMRPPIFHSLPPLPRIFPITTIKRNHPTRRPSSTPTNCKL